MKIRIREQEIIYDNRPEFWYDASIGTWESYTFDVLDNFIEKDKVFLDIGAWNGVFSLYAAKLGTKVFAIEPDIVAFAEMQGNIIINKLQDEITVVCVAVSDTNGRAELNSMDNKGLGNSESSLINRGKILEEITVETKTLTSLCEVLQFNPKDIFLIKMDVEGAESLIIPEAKEFLQKYQPTMNISFHPQWFAFDKLKAMAEVLFEIYDVFPAAKFHRATLSKLEFMNFIEHNVEHNFTFVKKNIIN